MHPADIKASLSKAGFRQSTLARALQVTEAALHLVIQGKSKSRRIALAVSDATGKKVNDLWPGKYPALEVLQRAQVLPPSRISKPGQQTKPRKAA